MSWKTYLEQHQSAHLGQLRDFLAIPSISAQPASSEDVKRAAQWLAARFKQAGFLQAEALPTSGHPVVFAEYCPYPDRPTVLFYGHYDRQPRALELPALRTYHRGWAHCGAGCIGHEGPGDGFSSGCRDLDRP